MSSKRGQPNKGKVVARGSNFDVDQLNQAVHDVNLDAIHDDGWEVICKKNKNSAGTGSSSNQCASLTPKPNVWGQTDAMRLGGRGNVPVRAPTNVWGPQTGGRSGGSNYNPTSSAIPPPLQGGWDWNSRPTGRRVNMAILEPPSVVEEEVEDLNETEEFDDTDDELLSDGYNSDEAPNSHEVKKNNKWYADFFVTLDKLKVEQINEPTRQWHCPACKNGPGAIDWYKSLQALVAHAKTKGSKRVKIHRNFAQTLEEELSRRGTTVIPVGESYGKWKGLKKVVTDREIVWPPMVIIMNTRLEQDQNDKWTGMGNQELLAYFGSYAAAKARHAYGPSGHRGMSVLIFEPSAVGFTEAERLSKHFEEQSTDRDAWDHRPVLFLPGGRRQLYGYMATKSDMDAVNRHCTGKAKLKFEMVSYLEKVVNQLKHMSEENQELHWYKNKAAKEEMHTKAVEESFELLSQKLRKTEAENRIVRERTRRYHEENKDEMDAQEEFFKNQLKIIHDARMAKEGLFDKLQQEESRRVDQSYSTVDPQKRDKKFEEMKEFEDKREKLMKWHEKRKTEMKARHWNEELELEEGLNVELIRLMNQYTPQG